MMAMRNPIVFLAGLPCSGKTTIANKLAERIDALVLDGDGIRGVKKNQDFTREGRKKHVLSVARTAYDASLARNVVVALIAPYRDVREQVKATYENVLEVFVNCPVEVCEERDVKGMYEKARRGEIKGFTGVDEDAPYEAPLSPDVVVHTALESLDESVGKIIGSL